MKRNVLTAIVIVLVVMFISGTVSLAFIRDREYIKADPTKYVSEDAGIFIQFDFETNAQDLVDELKPLMMMFGDSTDELTLKLLNFDYSFVDLAGFIAKETTDYFELDLVYGLKLSGVGDANEKLLEFFELVEDDLGLDVYFDEESEYFIVDDVTIKTTDDYILFSTSDGYIKHAIEISEGKHPNLQENEDWKKIADEMSDNFSFFVQIPEYTTEEFIPVAGTYVNPDKTEYGLELILIDGRDQFKKIFSSDESGEMADMFNTFFDSATDLSEVISSMPDKGFRLGTSSILNIEGFLSGFSFIDGTHGEWVDLDSEKMVDIGTFLNPGKLEPNELIEEMFTEEYYRLVETDYGYEIYELPFFFDPEEDDFDVDEEEPDKYCQILDNGEIYIVSNESMMQDEWEKTDEDEIEPSVLYAELDVGELLELLGSSEIADESTGFMASMAAVSFNEAGIMSITRLYEDDSHIRFRSSLTGNFEKLMNLLGNLLP